ncbi:MAG: diacylglycerol/lipid kinase family protein [Acidimicrobiia bacterium]
MADDTNRDTDRDVHLIVNPERSDVADDVADLADVIEEPDSADALEHAARGAADADVVAAVGGDGTQRTVAEVLARRDASLLVVPAGTVNFLGRLHGIETTADARRALVDGEDRAIDLGRADGEAFLLNASTGYDADVMAAIGDGAKRFGRLGIGLVGAAQLTRARTHGCRVVVDGRELFDGRALTVLVMNVAQRGSTSFELAPGAAPDDGRLHVVVVTGRGALVRSMWTVARGGRPREDDVASGAGGEIDVEWDVEVAAQRDGDPADRGRRFHYDVEPGAVTLRVPRAS